MESQEEGEVRVLVVAGGGADPHSLHSGSHFTSSKEWPMPRSTSAWPAEKVANGVV